MGESVTGYSIKAISFDSVNIAWAQTVFFSLTLYQYSLKGVNSFLVYIWLVLSLDILVFYFLSDAML